MKTRWLLLVVGLGLAGCQASRQSAAEQQQQQAAGLAQVREWVRQGNLPPQEFLFNHAHFADFGAEWQVQVPLASLNDTTQALSRWRSAYFTVDKASGKVTWAGTR